MPCSSAAGMYLRGCRAMVTHLDLDIRERLVAYLTGEIGLRDFRAWYVPTAWNVNTRRHGPIEDLVNEIDLRLAEFTNGHWSEDELRNVLRPLAQDYRGMIVLTHNGDATPDPPFSVVSRSEAAGALIPADIQLANASG